MRRCAHLTALAAFVAAQDDQRPVFHVMPAQNWMNDPNGPFYDARHGNYHLFYQYNPFAAVWGNMSWGHSISSDMVFWKHLPVALYPNNTYDVNGVFSGSITVVQGTPVISYTCVGPTGQLQCLAYPSNTSDPELVSWYKDPANPVIPQQPLNTQGGNFRDDTTAWFDEQSQQWLMAMGNLQPNATGAVQLYSSYDFATWTYSNALYAEEGLGMIECPDFFPLDGTNGTLYALKMSSGPDSFYIGTYDSVSRTFTPKNGPRKVYDFGQGYASKTFYDPVGKRRILWIWVAEEDGNGPARGWASTQSLPRVITYDPPTGSLKINPLPELSQLRTATLASVTSPMTISDGEVSLIPGASGTQLEIDANFSMPSISTSSSIEFGITVRTTSDLSLQTRIGLILVQAGGPVNNTDRPGGDGWVFDMDPTLPEATNVANCSAMCAANATCPAWVYVRPGDGNCRCCLKTTIPAADPNNYCVSGITKTSLSLSVNRTNSGTDGSTDTRSGLVPIVAGEPNVARLRIFIDHSIIETFANDGRGRITSRVYPTDADAIHVGVYAVSADVVLQGMQVWSMGTIWSDNDKQ